MSHIRTGNRPRWGGKRSNDLPNNRLQRTLKGRGETLVASVKCSGRAPSKPLKRGVLRERNQPRRGEPRGCIRHRTLPHTNIS